MAGESDQAYQRLQQAQEAVAQGRTDDALNLCREAVTQAPRDPVCHNALGLIHRRVGRIDDALEAFASAIRLQSGYAPAHHNRAEVLYQLGRHAEAAEACRQAVSAVADLPASWRLLADCCLRLGRGDDAAAAAARATALQPADPGAWQLRAVAEKRRGNLPGALQAWRELCALQPDSVQAATALGVCCMELGRHEEAAAAYARALELDPDYLPARLGRGQSLQRLVPSWHVPMMNEAGRNEAYREAIRRVVSPGDHVLEIGTGAGLLAMLTAEAGAQHVTSCERVSVLADEARRIVERNGLADRITVVGKDSTRLEPGVDMPGRADVLVSEILANSFVEEGVVPSINDARERLLKPGARLIPSRGSIMGTLVGGDSIRRLLEVGEVCGFDMHSFNRFRAWQQYWVRPEPYDALSEDIELLTIDFETEGRIAPFDLEVPVQATQAGRCFGVLQWLRIELAPGVIYENHPEDSHSHWYPVLFSFPEPIDLAPGDTVVLRVLQVGSVLYITR